MKGYPVGSEWHWSHQYEKKLNENCAICGNRHLKRNMYGVFLVRPGNSTPKKWCYLCDACLARVADMMEAGIK